MDPLTTVGIDLAKDVFAICVLNTLTFTKMRQPDMRTVLD